MERTKAIIRFCLLAPIAALLGIMVGGMFGLVGAGIEAALGLGTDSIGRIMQLIGAVLGAIGGVFIVFRRYFPKTTVSDVFGTAR